MELEGRMRKVGPRGNLAAGLRKVNRRAACALVPRQPAARGVGFTHL